MIRTIAILTVLTVAVAGCSTIPGSPILLTAAVKQVCLTSAELAALRRETKVAIAQNNDLTGKSCGK